MGRQKAGLWVNYSLTDGDRSPYAASMLGNLRHWLGQDPGIRELVERGSVIRREELSSPHECGRPAENRGRKEQANRWDTTLKRMTATSTATNTTMDMTMDMTMDSPRH